ncbi:MAG: hypothetical protein SFZ03_04480 [Candidatus Melainabacteria bacterium]|nr:hypothetical protein [Candidatus Melainabacteria bacterium]
MIKRWPGPLLKKLLSGTLLVVWWLSATGGFALAKDEKPSPAVITQETASPFQLITLRAGTPLMTINRTPIHTRINRVGDPVEAALTQPIYIGTTAILDRNVRLRGNIHVLELPLQGRNAVLGIQLNELILPSGERLPIAAHIKTEQEEHLWGGELTEGTVPKVVTHRVWGIGEYNKVVMGGPRQMGKHLVALVGEHWTVILDQPVTLALPQPDKMP